MQRKALEIECLPVNLARSYLPNLLPASSHQVLLTFAVQDGKQGRGGQTVNCRSLRSSVAAQL